MNYRGYLSAGWIVSVVVLQLVVGPFPGKAGGDDSAKKAATKSTPQTTVNSVGMRLVLIPAGEFQMGAPESEVGSRIDERPVHRVRITRPFLLDSHEVTQEEYQKVMGINPSYFSSTGAGAGKVQGLDTWQFPVEQVAWTDAVAFCEKLSALPEEQKAGRVYRLPTEAEWQYACRAGTTTPFHYGAALGSRDANINGNFPYGGAPRGVFLGRTAKVGSYSPNAFGLFDMHGNVAEMTADWYARFYYKDSPADDPRGPENGGDRVVLGGGWGTDAARCRAAFRRSNATSGKAAYFGFRVALDVPVK
ncbi:MAG TPA: formylglycine-generating enzyme family protein [Planctomycetaceae bacterium]|nr:formylglycine-generating enzyme family protein [Planctomycetaceae bacterium]